VILAQSAEIGPFEAYFVRLIDGDLGGIVAIGAVLAAVGIGAAHGLAPGHGKSIAAAYLLGARGRIRHAIGLGVVVAAMHAGSVIVLGLVLYSTIDGPFAIDRLVPWMMLAAAVLVLIVGTALVVRQVRRRRRTRDVDDQAGHHHHHHLPDGVSPFSRRGLVIIGLAGGLLPSPAAFLVLATAIFLERILYGVALVAAFSVGLAATVSVVGILVLRGRDAIADRAETSPLVRRLSAVVPLVASVGVLIGGLWLTVAAIMRMT
jgi:nickel/cobalt transporter (NicO) family protein